jgi:hypothetical protein
MKLVLVDVAPSPVPATARIARQFVPSQNSGT